MNLPVWDPFHEMEQLLDKYGRSSRRSLAKSDDNSFEVGDWMPTVDISETSEAFAIKVELPGVKKEDISVTLDNNTLTIKGEKQLSTESDKQHRIECTYGSFIRSFNLPQVVNGESVDAQYQDGVLLLTLPKQEKAKPKLIEVQVN